MRKAGLRTLLGLVEALRPALTEPGFERLLVMLLGWVRVTGRHTVTEALVAAGVSGRVHHEAFHRFFSRGSWSPDEWGRRLFRLVLQLLPEGVALRVALDDTLAPKKGPKVFGIGIHLDAVRSTRRHRVFCFGHVWVVLAVLVRVPFSQRTWALPVLLRLYRNEKDCTKSGVPHRKKTELAREMLEILMGWFDGRIELVADSAYCNDTVAHELPERIVFIGAMRLDAVLTAPPPPRKSRQRGRPRIRGELLRKPEALADDGRTPWKTCTATLYGKQRVVHYKDCLAQWYRALGPRLVRVIIAREEKGSFRFRIFFSTDISLPVASVLEAYQRRWAIEVCFRDLKQLLGFADSPARKQAAVERTAPFVAYLYTLLLLWASRSTAALRLAAPPRRLWYLRKSALSFEDILRAARLASLASPISDLLPPYGNFRNSIRRSLARAQQNFKFAA